MGELPLTRQSPDAPGDFSGFYGTRHQYRTAARGKTAIDRAEGCSSDGTYPAFPTRSAAGTFSSWEPFHLRDRNIYLCGWRCQDKRDAIDEIQAVERRSVRVRKVATAHSILQHRDFHIDEGDAIASRFSEVDPR